jgi:hypothetical protein
VSAAAAWLEVSAAEQPLREQLGLPRFVFLQAAQTPAWREHKFLAHEALRKVQRLLQVQVLVQSAPVRAVLRLELVPLVQEASSARRVREQALELEPE